MKAWRQNGKAVRQDGKAIRCDHCPCGCVPKVLYGFTVDGRYVNEGWADLSAWTGDGIGFPGAEWRLIELSDCYIYASGPIDENGRLAGLPEKFTTEYFYKGYMQIQQGCKDEFKVVTWPDTPCEQRGK